MRSKKEIVKFVIAQESSDNSVSALFFKKICDNMFTVDLSDVQAILPEAIKFTTRTITCKASDGILYIKNYSKSIGFEVK